MTEPNSDPRYWIDYNPTEKPFGGWTMAVVDEEEGGVIAYAYNLSLAERIVRLLEESGKER